MTTLTTHPAGRSRMHDGVAAVARVLDFLFGLLYTLLVVRLALEMLRARRGSGFFELIASWTAPFYAPFRDIVPSDTIDGAHPIVWPIVIAIVAYMLLHAVIRGVLQLISRT